MTQRFPGKWVATATLAAAVVAAPQSASAAVELTGCAGGSFGNACGLDELIAGGSMVVNGYRFSNFTVGLNAGRPLVAGAIRVDAIDSATGPGFALVDAGRTLRTLNGELTSSNLGFDIAAVSGSPLLLGGSLRLAVGDLTGSGSYANAFADLFNQSFTTFLGNMTAHCDGPACTNGTVASTATFAAAGTLSVIAGIDVAAAAGGGLAQINGLSMVLTPVPEPGAWSLFALGLGTFAWRQRKVGHGRRQSR